MLDVVTYLLRYLYKSSNGYVQLVTTILKLKSWQRIKSNYKIWRRVVSFHVILLLFLKTMLRENKSFLPASFFYSLFNFSRNINRRILPLAFFGNSETKI